MYIQLGIKMLMWYVNHDIVWRLTCNRRAQESLYYANGLKSLWIPLFSDKDAIQLLRWYSIVLPLPSFWYRVSCSSGWPWILLPHSLQRWDYRHVSPRLTLFCPPLKWVVHSYWDISKCSLYIWAINSLQDISLWLLLINIIFMDLFVFHELFINSHILLYEYNLLSWWTLGYFKSFGSPNSAVLLVNFYVHFLCIQFYSE